MCQTAYQGQYILTNVSCIDMFFHMQAINQIGLVSPEMKTYVDCISSHQSIRLPGLIDTHVHVREPGQTHKEDFVSCTRAALAGGMTLIGAMPNTMPAIVDKESLALAQKVQLVTYNYFVQCIKPCINCQVAILAYCRVYLTIIPVHSDSYYNLFCSVHVKELAVTMDFM